MSQIKLKVSDDDPSVAYVTLPKHPGKGLKGIVAKQVRLCDAIDNYKGIDIILDFDSDNEIIGIEIVG